MKIQSILSKEKTTNLSIILFWGAIWGLFESTIGLLLHAIRIIPTGTILFPIGYYFMQRSYRATDDIKSIFYTSAVAASIKLINLFSPLVPTIKVLNPSACILLEGLGVVIVLKYLLKEDNIFQFVHALTMSTAWRVGYYILCFGIFIPLGMMKSSSITNMSHFIEFFLINATINSFIIYIYEKVKVRYNKESKIRYHTLPAVTLYLLALAVQWIV